MAAAVALWVTLLATGAASAAPPDAAKVRTAAEQFDAAVTALKQKDFEGAASHFEAADTAVPSPKALRQAIKARVEAGQGSRAATLAALALERSAGDEALTKLARETVEKFEPLLYKVSVTCAAPCVLAVGTRSVPGEAAAKRTVYLDPGQASLNASFPGRDGAASVSRDVEAKAGASVQIRFEPKKAPAPPPAEVPASSAETPPEEPKPEPPPERKGISPAFFGVSLAATVGVGAATIWSGIDTRTNPGAAAVQMACQGKGPSCPLYQQGLAKETRTNVLIGATAGGAALTVVLAIFTNWRGNAKPKPAPVAIVVPHGAVLGAAGAF